MGKKARIDRDYPALEAAINALRHKELSNFVYAVSKFNIKTGLLFEKEDFEYYWKALRTLIDKFEIERKIKYKEFRSELAFIIQHRTRRQFWEELIVLARESFNSEEKEDVYLTLTKLIGKSNC